MKYERKLSDQEVQILQHYVPDAMEWIDTAITEKIEGCRKKFLRAAIDKAIATNSPLPSTAGDIINQAFSDKAYKNRKQRDIEGVNNG